MSHLEIIRKYALPTIKNFPANGNLGHPLFVQDNARPHVDTKVQEFLTENRVRVMNWPPQSPDLNPIENLWAEVKRSVRKKEKPSNLKELDTLVKRAWREIPPELCRRLIASMPDRVNACIEAKGGPLKY